ncbi:MAG: hypothetical protein GF387_03270 [Candidatus Portnoybacteria bacterium]|nr:hypothetical protein [Candidatus Portnoybacteria bacterium]
MIRFFILLKNKIFKEKCICAKICDCENPPPDNWDGLDGVYHVSNECPVHNFNPYPHPDCPVHSR